MSRQRAGRRRARPGGGASARSRAGPPRGRRRLRAVFFDLDDTLYSTSAFARRARRSAVRAMVAAGLRADPEAAAAELEEVVREFSSNYDRHFNALLARLGPRACGGLNPAVLVAAGVVAYHEAKRRLLAPFPDVLPALRELSARRGLLLGVITSGLAVKQAEKLIRLGVLPFLDLRAVFITRQMGMEKGSPKLYRRACAAAGLAPGECMYVGDHPVRDADSAKAAGMVTVLVRRGGRHQNLAARTGPDYIISGFRELLETLARDFAVPPAPRRRRGGGQP